MQALEEGVIGRLQDWRWLWFLFLVAIVVACDRLLFAFLLHFRFTGRRRGVTSVSTKRKEVVVHGAAGGCGEKGEGRLGHEGKGQVQGEETRAKLSEA